MNEDDLISDAYQDFGKLRSKQSTSILIELIPKLIEVRALLIRLVNSQGRDEDPGELLDNNLLEDLNEQIQIARRDLDKKLN